MSGIISGVNYALLYSSDSSSALDASSSILSILYNGTNTNSISTVTATSTGNPLTDLKLAQANETADVAKVAKDPVVSRAITAFTTALGKATTIQQALSNPDVLQVLLTANNLASYVKEPALVSKALLSDPNDPKSLVNQLGDSNLLSVAKTYDFAANGLKALQNPQVVSTLTSAYAEVEWRNSLDKATPGLSNALAFLQQAGSIKTAYDILGDPINRAVVTTAYGIPQQIAFQDLPAQVLAITSHVDVTKFSDPKFVTSITDQYLLTMQQNAANSQDTTTLTSLAVQAGNSGLIA